ADDFRAMVARLKRAEDSAQLSSRGADRAKLEVLMPARTKQLRALRETLQALTDLALRVSRVLGTHLESILGDLLVSADARWVRLASDSEALLIDAMPLLRAIGSTRVEL